MSLRRFFVLTSCLPETSLVVRKHSPKEGDVIEDPEAAMRAVHQILG